MAAEPLTRFVYFHLQADCLEIGINFVIDWDWLWPQLSY